MNKFTRIASRIVISLLVITICCCGVTSNLWSDDYGFHGETDYVKLKNEHMYEMRFCNLAEDIAYIGAEFLLPPNRDGSLSIGIRTEDGREIATDFTFDLNQFSSDLVSIPYFSNNFVSDMEFAEWYVLRILVSGQNGDAVSISTVNRSFLFASVTDGDGTFCPNVKIAADQFYQWNVIPGCVAAAIILLCFIWFVPTINIRRFWLNELITVACAATGVLVLETATTNVATVTITAWLSNIIFVYLFLKLLQIVFPGVKSSGTITITVSLLIGAIAYFVDIFRGTPLVPWDIYATETALAVTDRYTFKYSLNLYFASCLCILGLILLMKASYKTSEEEKIFEFARLKISISACINNIRKTNAAILLVGVLFVTLFVFPNLKFSAWDIQETYGRQGFIVGFVGYSKLMNLREPKGYDEVKVQQMIEDYNDVEAASPVQAQNIILIMNESYSDLRSLNASLVSDDYMPFWDSLTENTVKGNLYVPVFGAGTCDSEFEVLTGLSTKYTGAYPYVIEIKEDIDSLARKLSNQEYQTIGFHPYDIANWKRNAVYPLLGFSDVHGEEDMDDPRITRWVINDEASYNEVVDYFENKSEDNLFVFNVTMQNHGGYEGGWNDLDIIADLSGQGQFPQAEQYYSLISLSDQALEELVTYFSNVDEPTLICVFGDHQPKIESEYYEYLMGKPVNKLSDEENLQRYVTPFLIWTNYDIEEDQIEAISANYLRTLILSYAGYNLTGVDAFLYNLAQEYPVLTKNGILDQDGVFYEDLNNELLNQYSMICYYILQGNLTE